MTKFMEDFIKKEPFHFKEKWEIDEQFQEWAASWDFSKPALENQDMDNIKGDFINVKSMWETA